MNKKLINIHVKLFYPEDGGSTSSETSVSVFQTARCHMLGEGNIEFIEKQTFLLNYIFAFLQISFIEVHIARSVFTWNQNLFGFGLTEGSFYNIVTPVFSFSLHFVPVCTQTKSSNCCKPFRKLR